MGIIDFFKTKTRGEWTAGPQLPLQLDLDRNAMNDVGVGEAEKLLWRFGPPEDKDQIRNGFHYYYSRGFVAEVTHGRVESWLVFWRDRDRKFDPFIGQVRWRNKIIPLTGGLTEIEVTGLLGAPFWRDEDEAEILLFYERHAVEWQVEIDRKAGLSAMTLTAMPLLADAQQRRAYGVNRPWPPEAG